MIKNFSFPKMQNRQLIFSPKIQYKLAAERSEAASNGLRFSKTEGTGFEPVRDCSQPVFETGAFNHSANPPIHSLFQSSYCHRFFQSRTVGLVSATSLRFGRKAKQFVFHPPPFGRMKHTTGIFHPLSQPSNIKLPQFLRFFKNIVEYKS